MNISRFGLAALVIVCGALPAWSADLTKIDRTIAKEPAYQTATQKYCLLVFGPEAKTRIWLVADGDALHVSHTNGDFVGVGSRVALMKGGGNYFYASIGDITEVDGKAKHTSLGVSRTIDTWTVRITLAGTGRAACRLQGAGYDPAAKLRFADRPQDAPIVHFNGPKTLALSGAVPTLERGQHGTTVMLGMGTPGLGKGTFAAFQGCAVPRTDESDDLSASIAFPSATDPEEKIFVKTTIANNH
jgi:hypothetical protein